MGRVYNALVKADRLTGRERPIGRPASQDAETNRPAEQARANSPRIPSFNSSAQSQLDSNFAPKEITAPLRNAEHVQSPATARPLISPARVSMSAPSIDSPRGSATSDALPPKPIFVEPREVINIRSLSLAPHLSALTASDALACERYRTLAVRVISSLARRKLKTLLVTSAEQGEGKSAVATSLAWMMAKRDNRRVLLIDAGLRTATSSPALNIAGPRGWLEITNISSVMADALVRLDPNKLYAMSPYGANQKAAFDNAALDDALTSAEFEKLVAELEGYFDFIVIDGPAICRSYGAQQLASIADGTILVARAGQTHHSRVTTAVEMVPQERRVGIVLNESEIERDAPDRNGAKASFIRRLFGVGRARAVK